MKGACHPALAAGAAPLLGRSKAFAAAAPELDGMLGVKEGSVGHVGRGLAPRAPERKDGRSRDASSPLAPVLLILSKTLEPEADEARQERIRAQVEPRRKLGGPKSSNFELVRGTNGPRLAAREAAKHAASQPAQAARRHWQQS